MDNETTRVDYILSVTSDEVDAALKKLKLLEKEVNIANKESMKAYRQGILNDRKRKTNVQKRHYERQDDIARMNALTKKYDAITKRKNLKSLAKERYEKLEKNTKLKQQDLDRKDFEALEKADKMRADTVRKERESVEENIRKNEKVANMRLEAARKEREAKLKYGYLNKKEDNKVKIAEAKLKQQSYSTRYKEIQASKKAKQADERLALAKQKLAMQIQQQQRLEKIQSRAGRGSRRPFESMMMAIGSFMLLQYAVQMPFMWASALGDAMANVEMDSRKGHAYRQSMQDRGISTTNFDEAVKRYSEISGEQGYLARTRMAKIYGQVEQSGQSVAGLNPEYIANALQGMTVGMGMSDEQADKKLAELLSGRLSKEDRKMFGIKSRTPMQVLEEMNATMQKNPVIASTLREGSATSDMKFIRGAKNELLSRINDLWGGLFREITKPMKEFIKTFFGLDNKNVLAEWITTLSTIRDNIEKVFTKQNSEKFAVFINRFVSGITMFLGSIAKFSLDHPLLATAIVGGGLYNKSKTGSFFIPPWLDKILGRNKDVQKVYVTNMPSVASTAKNTLTGAAILSAIKSGIIAGGPYIAMAIAGAIGWKLGQILTTHFLKGRDDYKDHEVLKDTELTLEERQEYFKRKRSGEQIYLMDYIKEKSTPEEYKRFLSKNKESLDIINKFNYTNTIPTMFNIEEELIKTFNKNKQNVNNITNNYTNPYIPVDERNVFDKMSGNKMQVSINATNLYMNGKDFTADYLMNSGGATSYAY